MQHPWKGGRKERRRRRKAKQRVQRQRALLARIMRYYASHALQMLRRKSALSRLISRRKAMADRVPVIDIGAPATFPPHAEDRSIT